MNTATTRHVRVVAFLVTALPTEQDQTMADTFQAWRNEVSGTIIPRTTANKALGLKPTFVAITAAKDADTGEFYDVNSPKNFEAISASGSLTRIIPLLKETTSRRTALLANALAEPGGEDLLVRLKLYDPATEEQRVLEFREGVGPDANTDAAVDPELEALKAKSTQVAKAAAKAPAKKTSASDI